MTPNRHQSVQTLVNVFRKCVRRLLFMKFLSASPPRGSAAQRAESDVAAAILRSDVPVALNFRTVESTRQQFA